MLKPRPPLQVIINTPETQKQIADVAANTKPQQVGLLFQPETEPSRYHFQYNQTCTPSQAVSLTMPITHVHYTSDHKVLHPIFDMNLPEGALAERLRKQFSKVIPHFDALDLLRIVGPFQLGRLRFAPSNDNLPPAPAENLQNLLTHDGAEGLFEELLNRHAVYSGLAGAMPKVMLRDSAHDDPAPERVTHRGATHIVKAWTNEYTRLAENEYFCMRAALHAKLPIPTLQLSQHGLFLAVERFDLLDNQYLGFEDFCVLNGKTADQKYEGSYENLTKRIREFVSPEFVREALERFFKTLVLSCIIRNGDAHLKNFGVLYTHPESTVWLSPVYDLVTTTVYNPADILALTLGGTKRWPKSKILLSFARTHCTLSNARANELINDVRIGVERAAKELNHYLQHQKAFETVGNAMLQTWKKGLEELNI